MINRIIEFSIKNKLVIALFVFAIIGMGVYSMRTINLGAKPDITNNQVQVITVAQNLATEDIEQFITYPVELALGNIPGVEEIRSISRFGLSVVTIVFKDDMGMYLPRQLVQEKLNEVEETIPEGLGKPEMGPISTGLGEIYQYTLEAKPGYENRYSPQELRTIQDWIVKRQLTLLKGVVEVNAFGGSIKQYEIALAPNQLNSMDVSISDVFTALQENNVNTGGAYIVKNNMANFIRGEGLVQSLDDIRNIVVKNVNGYPILIKDVAKAVHFGNQVRYGAFTKDGHEAVGGMVLMLRGANPNKVITRVKDRIDEIQQSLPEGLVIEPFLDRSDLIHRTTSTIVKNLTEGALIVLFVLVLLLGSIRGGLVTASLIPLSLLFAFILMKEFGIWANLMSLGAIDFGIIVDGAVIIVEGTVHELEKYLRRRNEGKISYQTMDALTLKASSTMMNSAFFGQLIILIVFTPILFLTGVEGKMFRPMAFTFGFAVLGAIILCLTYVPMISSLLMRPPSKTAFFGRIEWTFKKMSQRIIKALIAVYHPLIEGALKIKWGIIGLAVALLCAAGFLFSRMGGEFIPELDEGDIAMHVLLRPGSALSETIAVSEKIEDSLLAHFAEVKTVTARIGVADIPTDPMPMDIADMFIILEKDQSKWTSADNKKELIAKIKQKLQFLTGVNLSFSQPIEMRFNELLTGVQEDVAIKLYGPDLTVLAQKGKEIVELIEAVPGVGEANAERTSGLPQIVIHYDRQKIAQYGLSIAQLNQYVNTAFAGASAGTIFEGEKRFDMVVRFDTTHRNSLEDLRNLYVDLSNHTQLPLKELATIEYVPGPMQISRENTFRRTYVGVNVRGRDVESVVTDIQRLLKEKLTLPPGYHLSYGGAFENLQRAENRLLLVVPIALLLIFLLLFFALKSLKEAVMIYLAVPLAAIGGVFFLSARGMPFSISAGVGFIVLFGVAVLNGLVLISRFNVLKQEGVGLKERIFIGTEERLRPILLTATAAIMGFIPMAFSSSPGAEVQRPLATVVIGGLISATVLTLLVLPVIYALIEQRSRSFKHPVLPSILLVLLLAFPFFGNTQQHDIQWDTLPGLTKQEAVQHALDNYPSLQKAALEIEKATVVKKSAWDFGTTEIFTGKEEFNRSADGVTTLVGIQQSDIAIFGAGAALRLQKEKITWAKEALSLNQLQVKQKVESAWYAMLFAKRATELYRKNDALFAKVVQRAKIQQETGEIAPLDYLSNANKAREVHMALQQHEFDYKIAVYQLNLWLASDTLFGIDTTEWDLKQEQPSLVFNAAHPALILAEQEVAVAHANEKVEKTQFLPHLSSQYGMQRIGGVNGFHSFQVGISIPLIFGKQRGAVQAARVERLQKEAELKQQKIQFETAYQEQRLRFLKWQTSWRYYRDEALPLAQKQQEAALISLQTGAIDYATFLQHMDAALAVEKAGLSAFKNYIENKIKLNYYTK